MFDAIRKLMLPPPQPKWHRSNPAIEPAVARLAEVAAPDASLDDVGGLAARVESLSDLARATASLSGP